MNAFFVVLFLCASVHALGALNKMQIAAISATNGVAVKREDSSCPIRLPLGSPFTGWNKVAQTVRGIFYVHTNIPGVPDGIGPSTIIVNPAQQAYVVNNSAAGGIQWTFANGTYFQIDGSCTFDATYGKYAAAVATYETNVVKIGELGPLDIYQGLASDFGTCGLGIGAGFTVNSENGAIVQLTFAQWGPSPYPGFAFTTAGTMDMIYGGEVGVGRIPNLPAQCLSLNLSLPSSQYCQANFFPPHSFASAPLA